MNFLFAALIVILIGVVMVSLSFAVALAKGIILIGAVIAVIALLARRL